MTRTKIEWATDTWNPVTGCTKVSEGCRHCYAERQVKRFGTRVHGLHRLPEFKADVDRICTPPKFTHVICHDDKLEQPLHWRKPRRVFVCSMSDLFHQDVFDDFRDQVFAAMILAPNHTFLVLTKRPEAMQAYMVSRGPRQEVNNLGFHMYELRRRAFGPDGSVSIEWPPPNVWLGVSVENQATADERIPLLLQTPAAGRFVSYEPALGPVDFRSVPGFNRIGGINPSRWWVICGGESGPGARPMHPGWARSMRDQCQAAGVPFFFKQWGEHQYIGPEYSEDGLPSMYSLYGLATRRQVVSDGSVYMRIGKKAAGRKLDGKVWDQVPEGMP